MRSMLPADLSPEVQLLVDVRRWVRDGRARDLRRRAGLSQSEAARAVGVSRRTINSWEHAAHMPTGARALAYGRLLAGLLARLAEEGPEQ